VLSILRKGDTKMMFREEAFQRLFEVLDGLYKRDLSQYECLWEDQNFYAFDQFLDAEEIPFFYRGFPNNYALSIPKMLKKNLLGKARPVGLFFIYPESEKEIIVFVFSLRDDHPWTEQNFIVCFKREDVFKDFITSYKKYCSNQNRMNNKIHVHGGQDIDIPDLSWDDVVLPELLKNDIKHNIEYFMDGEAHFKKLGIAHKRGFLFTGHPGNGKTMLLKIIASQYRSWKFIDFKNGKNSDNDDMSNVFKTAMDLAPSIICFEDVDSLFESGISLSHFLNKLDGFDDRNGTLVLATTNHPERIDPALTNRPSRFDRVWIISNPDYECRKVFLKRYFNHSFCADSIMEDIATQTEGFSMAYLKELYISSSLLAIQKKMDFPGEDEIMESFDTLSSQVKDAKNGYRDNVKAIGFGTK
jgi:AAA+ superfamily predicted ATPase